MIRIFLLISFFPFSAVLACPVHVLLSGSQVDRPSFSLDRKQRTLSLLKQHQAKLNQDPLNLKLRFEVSLDYLALGAPGRWDFFEKACVNLQEINKILPKNPLILIHLGRAFGARALNMEPSVWQRLRWAKTGFQFMDDAIKIDSDCFYLRLLRGEAQLLAHPILRRSSQLIEDFRYVSSFMKAPEFEILPNYQKARIYLFVGVCLKKNRRKTFSEHWQQVLHLAPNSHYAKEAEMRLKGSFQSLGYEKPSF